MESIQELTEEQKKIVATDVPRGQLFKIIAFAGCAKTSTLREYTKARPKEKFLYIAFNTAVAAEARDTFPFNVEARTAHSLAYRTFGYLYKNKLGFLRPYILTDHLSVTSYPVAKYIIDVVVKYLSSDDDTIMEKHLVLNREKSEEDYKLEKSPDKIAYLLGKANELWSAMKDTKNAKVPMIHDGYLKLFQLSKPQLPYDFVLLDEAHDTNDVTLDIFLNQKCSKILVGDTHQSIYEWRHAYDAIGSTNADINQYLSTSFRFGDTIASTANQILSTLKKEPKPIQGFQPLDAVKDVDTSKPYTVVARTNAYIFDAAANLIINRSEPPKFGFVGTTEKDNWSPYKHYGFDKIMDIFHLMMRDNSKIKDVYIKRFHDFRQFLEVINDKDAPDVELVARSGIVKKYTHDIPSIIDRIVHNSYKPSEAFVTFSTAHRSKGLEWNQVMLTNDYHNLVIEDEDTGNKRLATEEDINIQEVNLLYVAATRAKKTLQINAQLRQLKSFLDK